MESINKYNIPIIIEKEFTIDFEKIRNAILSEYPEASQYEIGEIFGDNIHYYLRKISNIADEIDEYWEDKIWNDFQNWLIAD